jgi:hypothetical protein
MGVFVEPAANIDTVYRLPTKENKLPCSISVYSKQIEVCHFHFLFAANKTEVTILSSFLFPNIYICGKRQLLFVCCIYTSIYIYAAVLKGNRKPT